MPETALFVDAHPMEYGFLQLWKFSVRPPGVLTFRSAGYSAGRCRVHYGERMTSSWSQIKAAIWRSPSVS